MSLLNMAAPIVGGQMAASKSIVGPNPNTLDARDQVMMTPQMFRATYDENYRRDNPANAALHGFRHRFQKQTQTPYILGQAYGRPAMQGAGDLLSRMFSTGTVSSGLMGGAAGLGLGYLGAKGINKFTGRNIDPKLAALFGGTLMAGIGAAGGHTYNNSPYAKPWHMRNPYDNPYVSPSDNRHRVNGILSQMNKQSSFRGAENNNYRQHMDDRNEILSVLRSSPGMSFGERSTLMRGVGMLSDSDAAQLMKMLGFGGGAYTGKKIANFLMGKGFVSSLIGAVTGGVIGGAIFGGQTPGPRTLGGQRIGRFL